MSIELFEHYESKCYPYLIDKEECVFSESIFKKYQSISPRVFPFSRNGRKCYQLSVKETAVYLKSDYYVGLDWLIEGERYVYVKPKLNQQVIRIFERKIDKEVPEEAEDIEKDKIELDVKKDNRELNYLKLLMDAMGHPEISKETYNLIFIDWASKPITIKSRYDTLTPLLVVQFLNLLKQIVKKGLKKSYYKVQENLNNRVKGKILVGAHIKQNLFKNRYTKTYCEYQEFGIDHQENRFLKKVLSFVINYTAKQQPIFKSNKKDIQQLINYCRPAFELVGDEKDIASLKQVKYNPLFKEYNEAIRIGQIILKRFAYNISQTGVQEIPTPPFWIDMPKLFELYVYHHLIELFPMQVKFQYSTYGNQLDFLITKAENQMVVDAKYKVKYQSSQIHDDIRQVSGYARLKKVYDELNRKDNELLDCLIVYPSNQELTDDFDFKECFTRKSEIKAYKQVYKIGIPMPYIL